MCIFDGIMDAPMYTRILENYLKPFIRDVYPTGHRFMQDNDPKHTSRHTQQFFVEHSINWWKSLLRVQMLILSKTCGTS